MASNIPVIVQGNSFSLAIPLQIYYINGDQMDLQDYTPDPTDEISIQLKGERRQYTYTPTVDGNICNIDLSGNELAGNYSVVVSIVKASGQRLRSFRTDQFFIVESSDDLTPADIIEGLEENVIYLNSSIFVAGADGRGIASITKTGTSGLVDTYTITYTDSTTSTFDVTNGAQGEAGATIASVEKTATVGKVDTYTITMTNGNTFNFEVTNGLDGVDLGLANIVNDLITGGATNVLSAEMGKTLGDGVFDGITTETISPALEQGGILADGSLSPSTSAYYTKRVRSEFIRVDGAFTINVAEANISINVNYYTDEDISTFVRAESASWLTPPFSGNFVGYIRTNSKKGSDAVFSPADETLTITRTTHKRRIEDNLNSTRKDYALSANQGRNISESLYGSNGNVALEQGGFSPVGEETISATRVRTGFIRVEGDYSFTTTPVGSKYNIFTFDDDGNFVSRLWSSMQQNNSYSGHWRGYIRVLFGMISEARCTPSDFSLTLTANGISQNVYGLMQRMPDPTTFDKAYTGEKINIGYNKFRQLIYTTLPNVMPSSWQLHQAMAVYGDYIVLFGYDWDNQNNPAKAYLFRISTATHLATLTLSNGTYMRPHCNSATFSEVFNTSDSALPLLYVSQWENDGQKCCFVYDIKLANNTYSVDLVQTILPTNVSTATLGAGQTDWVVDPMGYIYCIGYLLDNGATIVANNKTMITKFALPKVSDGAVVTFGDANVLDHFDVPIFIYRQDLCFENGRILMLAGSTGDNKPRRLVVINPAVKQISSKLSLDYINEEPEGIGVSDGKLLVGFSNDTNLYRLEFD